MTKACHHCGLPRKKRVRLINQVSPYEDYLQVGVPLCQRHGSSKVRKKLKGFIKEIELELDTCDDDISHLEAALKQLKEERIAGQYFLNRHKALASRSLVHRLPPEVLVEIFRMCGVDADGRYDPSRDGPCRWIPVCRRWRDIVNNSASLWASFMLRQPNHNNWLARALAKSEQAPLHIGLDLRGSRYKTIANLLIPHATRLETFQIDGLDHHMLFPLPASFPLPRLRSLSLSATCLKVEREDYDEDEDEDEELESIDWGTMLEPFMDCPHIRELSLRTEGIPMWTFETHSVSFPWSNLVKLTLSQTSEYSHEAPITTFLSMCVNLRTLTITGCNDSARAIDSIGHPIRLPYLTSLTVESSRILTIAEIEYPVLYHLSVRSIDPITVGNFVHRSAGTITHLEVNEGYSRVDFRTALEALALFDSVVDFTLGCPVSGSYYGRIGSTATTLSTILSLLSRNHVQNPLPNLQTLTINFECNLTEIKYEVDSLVYLIESRRQIRQGHHTERLQTLNLVGGCRTKQNFVVHLVQLEDSSLMNALRRFESEGLRIFLFTRSVL